ncbi:MAG: DUF4097 domain-containing protein, partial [Chloroflexota bacterium]|nr:DUF4097 domain-containing protein [Chloroflexota bacterium]
MTMTTPYDGQPPPHQDGRSPISRSFLPLALITLGVAFLLGNVVPGPVRGGLLFLGLGAAFAVGRVTTGRYGYSVPAGILIAIGSYVSLQEIAGARSLQQGGWFFVLLGLGFVAVYLIGLRPAAVWPLFPAAALLGLGLLLFGWAAAAPIGGLAWIVSYWPVALVLIGLWLLFRDQIPERAQAPLATVGGLALLAYGLVAALASVAAAGPAVRPDLGLNFGHTPFSDTITLDQPIAAGGTFSVSNSSGRTTLRGGSGEAIHVVATRRFFMADHAPEVRLSGDANNVSLDMPATQRTMFGAAASVDYVIDVPANVRVVARTTSGALQVDGIQGALQVESSSGDLTLTNIAGELRARSTSGDIRA